MNKIIKQIKFNVPQFQFINSFGNWPDLLKIFQILENARQDISNRMYVQTTLSYHTDKLACSKLQNSYVARLSYSYEDEKDACQYFGEHY